MMNALRPLGTLILAALLLGACATAPGTGRTIFTGGMSEADEKALGFEQHPKMTAEFGGTYDDPNLGAYVSSIGALLASTSELPNLDFTFTVLDSPVVNAFALPGGYVYVTRGLLAIAENEAQLAGVMAHEIGHVTARHSAERYGQSVMANIATAGLGILGGAAAANVGQTIGGLAVRSYSRDQEFESDMLGVRYLTRAGYDSAAMGGFLGQLRANSRLEAELAGRDPDQVDEVSLLQTHPRTLDRIQRAVAQAAVKNPPNPIIARDLYLSKLDGMIFGDNPDQGLIKGQRFIHPALRFEFTVPPGFRLANSASTVVAANKEGAFIVFDRADKPYRGSIKTYLTQVWAAKVGLENVEAIEIDGLPAATGRTRLETRNGPRDLRALAIRAGGGTIYRFLFVTKPADTKRLAKPFQRTSYSFRQISKGEAAAIKPHRLRLHRVKRGETAQKIARRMPFPDFQLQRLLVLNGLERAGEVKPGMTLKIIAE